MGPDAELYPTSHYGVYKVANEQAARVYWQTGGIASIGLRPHSAYGPGRDQGVTSKPTLAMIAAAAGRPYHVDFGGRYQFQFVEDVAAAFIAAARADRPGAEVYSLGGPRIGVDEIVEVIAGWSPGRAAGSRSATGCSPSPPRSTAGRSRGPGPQPVTPLEDGVRLTIETYRAGLRNGRLGDAYLDRVLA